MKKIALAGTTLALLMTAGSALADNSLNTGTFGLNVPFAVTGTNPYGVTGGLPQPISGRYFVAKDMAVLGGFGIANSNAANSGTAWTIMGGIRKYLKTDDFAPFVGGRLSFGSIPGVTSTSVFDIAAEAGAEYFLAKHFSLEGTVAFGYDSNSVSGGTATNVFETRAGISGNFYF